MVEYGHDREQEAEVKFKFGMTTNASLLDEDKLAFIKDHNLGVQVSFDGPAEVQDAQRPFKSGQGSYQASLPLIRRLLELCPETSCRATLMDGVDPGLVRDGLGQVGFREGFISPASPCLINDDQSTRPSERDFSGLKAMMATEAEQLLDRIKTRRADKLNGRFGFSLLPGFVDSFLTNRKKIFYCGAGRGMAAVSVSGDIYLCHRFVGLDDYKLGSVFDGPAGSGQVSDQPAPPIAGLRRLLCPVRLRRRLQARQPGPERRRLPTQRGDVRPDPADDRAGRLRGRPPGPPGPGLDGRKRPDRPPVLPARFLTDRLTLQLGQDVRVEHIVRNLTVDNELEPPSGR